MLVDRAHAFGGEFGVFDFLEALVADFGEPAFEGLGLGGWDGLDETQKLFRISDIGHALFAVGGGHFQPVTICNGFIALILEAFFYDPPIDLRIRTVGEDRNHIHDGKMPFFFHCIPSPADLLFFKEGDGGHGDNSFRGDWRRPGHQRRGAGFPRRRDGAGKRMGLDHAGQNLPENTRGMSFDDE